MDQSRALNSLAPFLALAKAANSPRAAADLVTQATSAANTYVFAELLQQPNIQALAGNAQYGASHTLLQIFAWGTWEDLKATSGLPQLSDAQARKLRLLSLLTIAAQSRSPTQSSSSSNLTYRSLSGALDLPSAIDLEQLVTEAIYQDLLTATLDPAAQTVIVTSVAPLRDLAPGSVPALIGTLDAWSSRCHAVLANLQEEIQKVHNAAELRAARDVRAERQAAAVLEVAEKNAAAGGAGTCGGPPSMIGRGHFTRGKRDPTDELDEDDDAMDVDGGTLSGPGRKKSGGGGFQGRSGKGSGR